MVLLIFRATTLGFFWFIALLWLLGCHSTSSHRLLFPSLWLEVLPFGGKWPVSYFGHVCPCYLFLTSEKLFLSVWKSLSHTLLTCFVFFFFLWQMAWLLQSLPGLCKLPPTQDCHRGLAWRMALRATTTSGATWRVPSQAMLRNVSPSWRSNWTASLKCFSRRAVCCPTERAPCWQLLHKQDWEGILWVGSIILCACCSSQKLHMLKSVLNSATKGWFAF